MLQWLMLTGVSGYHGNSPAFTSLKPDRVCILQTTPHSRGVAAMSSSNQELSAQHLHQTATSAYTYSGANQVYYEAQNQWFQENRSKRKGPPSAALSTPLATPHEDTDEEMDARPKIAQPQPADANTTPLIQPLDIDAQAAVSLAAAQAGINSNDPAAITAWLGESITTRKQVMETIRAYHTGVIRSEISNIVLQVEGVVRQLDNRLLLQHDHLRWLTQESRMEQKKLSGLQVLTTGWSPTMSGEERLYQLNWMFEQVDYFRRWLSDRGHNIDGPNVPYIFMNILQCEPATPPSGQQFSTVSILTFKSWDLRQQFMSTYGGPTGTPLYRDSSTCEKNRHVRATPASPQFQRKMEVPIRVLLSLINESELLESNQVTVLWKTLTIMQPQSVREFDDQIRAFARMHFFEDKGIMKGILEVTPQLMEALQAKPPIGSEEPTMWSYHWAKVVYGVQHELDVADQHQFARARTQAKGSGKGMEVGQTRRHWASSAVYSSADNPFPIEMEVRDVDDIYFVWDEYCDKFQRADLKIGSYQTGTVQGAPPSATPPTATGESALSVFAQPKAGAMQPPSWVPKAPVSAAAKGSAAKP